MLCVFVRVSPLLYTLHPLPSSLLYPFDPLSFHADSSANKPLRIATFGDMGTYIPLGYKVPVCELCAVVWPVAFKMHTHTLMASKHLMSRMSFPFLFVPFFPVSFPPPSCFSLLLPQPTGV